MMLNTQLEKVLNIDICIYYIHVEIKGRIKSIKKVLRPLVQINSFLAR